MGDDVGDDMSDDMGDYMGDDMSICTTWPEYQWQL